MMNGIFGTARFNQGHEWQNDHNTILTIVINIRYDLLFFGLMEVLLLIDTHINLACNTSSHFVTFMYE